MEIIERFVGLVGEEEGSCTHRGGFENLVGCLSDCARLLVVVGVRLYVVGMTKALGWPKVEYDRRDREMGELEFGRPSLFLNITQFSRFALFMMHHFCFCSSSL